MEFAGVKPEQLGRVKVTSVSERFLAEKEWQTVTRRGAVLACVGVPTVRKIEVELLMRAKNRSALPLLLEKVRAWLEESGEEKLHFDSMGGTYYKARCTGTDALMYSGASARLKVTFTYPWTINLVRADDARNCEVRYGRNEQSIKRGRDISNLCTRLYCMGSGEGVNQTSIRTVNPTGKSYIDSPNISKYAWRDYCAVCCAVLQGDADQRAAGACARAGSHCRLCG